MNVREGMRRLGIVFGLLGGIAGGFVGYGDVQKVWTLHRQFDSLTALPSVQKVAKSLKDCQDPSSLVLPPGASLVVDYDRVDKWAQYAVQPERPNVAKEAGAVSSARFDVNGARQSDYSDDEILQYLSQSRQFDVEGALKAGYSKAEIINELASQPKAPLPANKSAGQVPHKAATPLVIHMNFLDGVKTVTAAMPEKTISSIELSTGEWLYKEPRNFKSHLALFVRLLLPLLYPVIGFLIPWASICTLTWVGSGFVAPQ